MTRFYFDLLDGVTTLRDDVGVRAADLDQAVEEARAIIREMRMLGELDDIQGTWRLSIRSDAGQSLVIIPIQ